MIERPSWDEYFLEISKTVSLRADCTRSKVGAVLVGIDHRIIGTGYNGAPPSAPGCLSGACPRGKLSYQEFPSGSDYGNCISIHAERNAIIFSDPDKRKGSTIYVTRRPCVDCKELMLAEGVSRVVWLGSDNETCTEPLFE